MATAVAGKDTDFEDVFFADERTGWLVGYTGGVVGSKLFHTTDAGKTWQLLPSPLTQDYFESIHFLNEQDGWACGNIRSDEGADNSERAIAMHTIVGGQRWQQAFTIRDEPFFNRILFLNPQAAWLVAGDSVYRTDDGGKSWQAVLKLSPPARDTR